MRLDSREQNALDFLSRHVSGAASQSDVVRAAIRRYAKEIKSLQLREEAARLSSSPEDLAEMQKVLADAEDARASR